MKVKPEYEKLKEFRKIATELVSKYPDILDGVDIAKIECVAINNQEPKEGKPFWELMPVKYPIRFDVPFDQYLIVNLKTWDDLNEKHKALLIFDALCSIDKEDHAKVVPFDLKAHALIVRTIGTDFMQRNDIPDILKDNVEWKMVQTNENEENKI